MVRRYLKTAPLGFWASRRIREHFAFYLAEAVLEVLSASDRIFWGIFERATT